MFGATACAHPVDRFEPSQIISMISFCYLSGQLEEVASIARLFLTIWTAEPLR